jgi:hypothetical protein
VDCTLIVNPNTSYNGVSSSVKVDSINSAASNIESIASEDIIDMPPKPNF